MQSGISHTPKYTCKCSHKRILDYKYRKRFWYQSSSAWLHVFIL